MTAEFHTTQYELAHGRKPRGFGQWAFQPRGKRGLDGIEWANGTYAQAKAKVAAARPEIEHWNVCS